MERPTPKPHEIYRHFKGNCYRIVAIATNTENREAMVIYQALYGDFKVYARELSMFMSPVDKVKYPDATQEMRFELVTLPNGISPKEEPEEAVSEQTEETVPEQPEKKQDAEELSTQLHPLLLQFLDATTYADRLQILSRLHDDITDEMINTMAIAADVEIPEGNLEERYEQLKYCLITKEKFECTRLR